MRLIIYTDPETNIEYEFLTNDFETEPEII